MKIKVLNLLIVLTLFFASSAKAQWVDISSGLNEIDIQSVTADAKDPKILFAASERHVYRSVDGGVSWKQILGARGEENRVRFIYVDSLDSKQIYVCTDRGLKRSQDGGKTWYILFTGPKDSSKKIYCVARNMKNPEYLWVGTGGGLFQLNIRSRESSRANGIPEVTIYSILIPDAVGAVIFVTTNKGIYKSPNGGTQWERIFTETKNSENQTQDTNLEQFGVEQLSAVASLSNLVFLRNSDKLYAAAKNGVWEGSKEGDSWNVLKGQSLPTQKINFVEASSKTFYAATDKGVFQWDMNSGTFKEVYEGLLSKEVKALHYSPQGDTLLAATKKGVFKWVHPEFDPGSLQNAPLSSPKAQDILAHFANEPTILEIQNAAIRYAEVHPEKIEAWRKAAAWKALFPSLSLGGKAGSNENVDLDRGGTADPDKFIKGPDKHSVDWSAGVSWNLGELIWNNDQTSIDTRSRLMVELRDDVLNEATHLYFERRRLQVEMAMSPERDLPVQIEKEIRLQELTAGIDALTGGYLSKRLNKVNETEKRTL